MGKTVYEFMDLSKYNKVFAVGDIHGCFSILEAQLKKVEFDKEKDMLISVGDLVDRGPESHLAKDYVKYPWFKHILGNHELMTLDHLNGNSYMHTHNGGGWMADMPQEEKEKHVDALLNAPHMLEILTPRGYHVGFVHADLVFNNWQENIDNPHFPTLSWSRETVKKLRDPNYDPTIKGIDKVFFGHNALLRPYSRGNCNWIDTGCGFSDGTLTIVDVDQFGNPLNR